MRMINIQDTAVVGNCNEVFVCPGFSSLFVIWILMSADSMQPSIAVLIDLHRVFSSLTEKGALEQSLERRNLNRWLRFGSLVTVRLCLSSCKRGEARSGQRRSRKKAKETLGNEGEHWTAFFFLRIKSCGLRRDSGRPAFLSLSRNYLFFFSNWFFFLWPGLLLSFFCKRKFFRRSAGVGGETPESFDAWKEAVVVVAGAMATLDATRAELAFLVMYLNKAETRDKICRAIQYGSKFISNGEPGVAAQVDKTTSLARKVFRLAKVSKKKSRLSISS